MKTYGPEYEAWLAQLKLCDKWDVIIQSCFGGRPGAVATLTITGITKRHFKSGRDAYCKTTGLRVGSSSDKLPPPATEQELADLRREILQHHLGRKLSTVRWKEVSLEALTAIDAILNQSKETTA